jgi:hypothetical protein
LSIITGNDGLVGICGSVNCSSYDLETAYELLLENIIKRSNLGHQVSVSFVIETTDKWEFSTMINENKEINRLVAKFLRTGEDFPELPEGYTIVTGQIDMIKRGLIPLDK